jgi:NAD+ synthase (glutamine-hydrolysing)
VKVAIGQVNPLVGDLEGNVARCLEAARSAARQGAALLALPAMALAGAPPRDLLLDESYVAALGAAGDDFAARLPAGLAVAFGSAQPGPAGLVETIFLARDGLLSTVGARRSLRAADVYHEPRWLRPGPAYPPVELGGARVGFVFDGDLEPGSAADELIRQGAERLVCLAAEPWQPGAPEAALRRARRLGLPLAYANLWGANDELIYAGGSFALGAGGELAAALPLFAGETACADLDAPARAAWREPPPVEALYRALVLGIRDFMAKNRLGRAVVGVSGGVDSAVACALACAALGPGAVTAVSIPSRYTDPRSVESSRQLCAGLGCAFEQVELEPLHRAAEASLGPLLAEGAGGENVQARLRMLVLMAYVNRYGGILLNTTNKTELSVGYVTLYGDMAGMLCPLGDVTKPQVYELAAWIQSRGVAIPEFILTRPPSAELAPGQVDPFDYAAIAPRLEALVQSNRGSPELNRAEDKRRQMGVILRVSPKAFGSGRMMPITTR